MPFSPPRYRARSDWYQKLSGGPVMHTWQMDMVLYWQWRRTKPVDQAWGQLRMPPYRARLALTGAPPLPNNDAGMVPPEIVGRVFARALTRDNASPFDFDYPDADYLGIVRDPDLDVSFSNNDDPVRDASFKRARYAPRANWQEKLTSMTPPDGSWQAALVEYWRLRTTGNLSEADAWAQLNMSPDHCREALMTEPPTADNDSGLIPASKTPGARETVALRLYARAVLRAVEAAEEEVYAGLILDDPVPVA